MEKLMEIKKALAEVNVKIDEYKRLPNYPFICGIAACALNALLIERDRLTSELTKAVMAL